MPSLVQFDTTKFDFAHEPPNPINPIFGQSVLFWAKQVLGQEFVIGEPAAEDWGWYCDVTKGGVVYLLGASAEPNEDGSWHVMIQVEPHRSAMDRLTGKKAPHDELGPVIAGIARADPTNRNVELEGSR
jgi:hypothetical protein